VTVPEDLCQYLELWLARYPNADAPATDNVESRRKEQHWLAGFAGRDSLSQIEAREFVDWKFQADARRRANARRAIDEESWPFANVKIREALSLDGDLPPLMAMASRQSGIRGWGPAMSSVVLAVCRPQRFTIADTRALATIRALGFPVPAGQIFAFHHWEPYLAACRSAAERCGRSLREVDQALWTAEGIPHLPVRGQP